MAEIEGETAEARLLRKAINLFTFLGRTQELLVKPIRTVDRFEKAIWFGALPEHRAVRSAHRTASPDAEAPLLAVDRVPRLDPPALAEQLTRWVSGTIDDPSAEPVLRDAIYTETPRQADSDGEEPDIDVRRIELADVPDVVSAFESWLTDWRLWAERERLDAVVREIYKDLFALHLQSTDHSEEFELVLGAGCLSWRPTDHDQVQRHVATAPVAIGFDENTG
ncbi:MAG: ATP-binding protein IstB, partial [Actinomycetes bacterium]